MRVIVTGGAGFIGGHVAHALKSRSDVVIVIDNLSSGRVTNVPDGVQFIEMDIGDKDLISVLNRFRPDAVMHYAAQISVLASIRDPAFDKSVNVEGSLNVLNSAIQSNTRAFVNVSTGIVYGEPGSDNEFPLPETQIKNLPFPYSQSKYEFEKHLYKATAKGSIDAITLRPGNIYGPRQDPHGEAGVVAIFSKRLISGEPLVIHGKGDATRDYVYVGDMVKASLMALDFLTAGAIPLSTAKAKLAASPDDIAFNIATGIGTNVISVADALAKCARESGYQLKDRIHGDARPGEVPNIRLDGSKAREILGWTPQMQIKEGLATTFDWFADIAGKSV